MGKAKRVSKIAKGKRARAIVFLGKKEKTQSGLTKAKLVKNKSGKIVSKAASAASKKAYANSGIKAWADAVKKARKALNLTGFVAIGGKSATGKALCQGQGADELSGSAHERIACAGFRSRARRRGHHGARSSVRWARDARHCKSSPVP